MKNRLKPLLYIPIAALVAGSLLSIDCGRKTASKAKTAPIPAAQDTEENFELAAQQQINTFKNRVIELQKANVAETDQRIKDARQKRIDGLKDEVNQASIHFEHFTQSSEPNWQERRVIVMEFLNSADHAIASEENRLHYEASIQNRLKRMNAKLGQLKNDAKNTAKYTTQEARQKAEEAAQKYQTQKEKLDQKFEDFRLSVDEKWEPVRDSLEKEFQDLNQTSGSY